MATKLFVGNLSWDTTDDTLRAAFEQYGEVESAEVVTDRVTGRSRGFGFVKMVDDAAAEEAIAKLNRSDLDGRPINVDRAQERPERRPFGEDAPASAPADDMTDQAA